MSSDKRGKKPVDKKQRVMPVASPMHLQMAAAGAPLAVPLGHGGVGLGGPGQAPVILPQQQVGVQGAPLSSTVALPSLPSSLPSIPSLPTANPIPQMDGSESKNEDKRVAPTVGDASNMSAAAALSASLANNVAGAPNRIMPLPLIQPRVPNDDDDFGSTIPDIKGISFALRFLSSPVFAHLLCICVRAPCSTWSTQVSISSTKRTELV
jgi:hypothetical protein